MPAIGPVGLLGGGVIGRGWAARFVLNGADVRVFDPDPDAPHRLTEVLENARRAQRRLTLAPLPPEGTLEFAATPEEAAEGAGFVQESGPEREDLKRTLLGAASRAAPPDAVIASSTSGLPPSRLQTERRYPERFCVGHPFNPVYLLPLVEVCGGALTASEAIERAAATYRSIGMYPLVVRREIDAFVADRLLEALWREALWLVHDDVATVEEIDDAMRFGAGLRWAQMGTFLTYRIAGGEEGMRHFLGQFGPALAWPWTKLTDVPELTDELVERIAAQSDAQAGGLSVRDLERIRDDNLVALLQALRANRYAAGETLAAHEERLFAAPAPVPVDPERPLRLHECAVDPAWLDYNGHMTEARYGDVLAYATDAFLRHVGLDAEYLAGGHSAYTVETHIRYLREATAFESLAVETQVLGADEKRLHLFHELRRLPGQETLATGEHLLLHVDSGAGKVVPWGE